MRIGIINGPNLNLLGEREPHIYGSKRFEESLQKMRENHPDVEFTYFQSNIEGEIVDALQQMSGEVDFIILNAASYTHTSLAIGDVVAAIGTPVIEVHISNVYKREGFRQHSYVSPHAVGIIVGFGLPVYDLAVEYCLNHPR